MTSQLKPPKKSLSLPTPTRRKPLQSTEIYLNEEDTPSIVFAEIEKIKAEMPLFSSLQQQVKYFHQHLKNVFGDLFNIISILIKLFPFNNSSSLVRMINQKEEFVPTGRKSFISPVEKEIIIKTCYENFDQGNPLRISDIYSKVFSCINSEKVTLEYFTRFIYNNSKSFQIYQTETIEGKRISILQEDISRYFQQVKTSICGISPKLICNIDEIGFGDMQQSDGVFVVGRPNIDKKNVPKYPVPSSINRITALVTVFLDGTTTTRFIIVPSSTIHKSAFHYLENCVDARIEHQENGYMDSSLFRQYIERILLPAIHFRKSVFPELISMTPVVILDGCRSHHVEQLKKSGISTVFIPPHSSHIFQPCDASLFASIKKRYRENLCKIDCPEINEKFDNLSRVSASLISIILSVKSATSDSKIIKSSFKCVGLFDDFGIDNRLVSFFDPNTSHVKKFITNESLLKEFEISVKENKRKRIKIEDL